MYFTPSKKTLFENKKTQFMFESLPTKNILSISEERIKELEEISLRIRDSFVLRKKTYFKSNNSIKDFFSEAVNLVNYLDDDYIIRHFNCKINNKDELGIIIMFICDNNLKYLNEYKNSFSLDNDISKVKERLITKFGFYSPKFYIIELHYSLLLEKINNKENNLLIRKKGD